MKLSRAHVADVLMAITVVALLAQACAHLPPTSIPLCAGHPGVLCRQADGERARLRACGWSLQGADDPRCDCYTPMGTRDQRRVWEWKRCRHLIDGTGAPERTR